MVSFKSQTRTLSRGPVLELGYALSTQPPSTHHTLAHMHTAPLPPWVRDWEGSLVTGSWLLPTKQVLYPRKTLAPGVPVTPRVWTIGLSRDRAQSVKFLCFSLCSTAFHKVSQIMKENENHGPYDYLEMALSPPLEWTIHRRDLELEGWPGRDVHVSAWWEANIFDLNGGVQYSRLSLSVFVAVCLQTSFHMSRLSWPPDSHSGNRRVSAPLGGLATMQRVLCTRSWRALGREAPVVTVSGQGGR